MAIRGTSNVNPLPGQVVATLVEVGIGTGGDITVYNNAGIINVAIDIEGYVESTSSGLFTPTAPTRICDTRASGGGISSNQCDNSSPGAESDRGERGAFLRRLWIRKPCSDDGRDRSCLQPNCNRSVRAQLTWLHTPANR